LRRFEGWAPERRTEYEHDNAGQLVASTEFVEPEWDAEQQAVMVAYTLWEAGRCPACGGDPAECQGADAEFAWKATGPIRCHRIAAIRKRERAFLAGKTDEIGESLLVGVERQG
jgi:hypothetical protein